MSEPTFIAGWFIPAGATVPGFGGGRPAGPDSGYDRPTWERPDNSLPGGGHISTGPIYPGGHPGGGPILPPVHIGGKPPGIPILPPSVDNGLPPSRPPHIWGGGIWVILDPGWDLPPVIGVFPPDLGFGIPETPPPGVDNTLPDGTWVPTDPDFGKPIYGCPGKPKPPRWAWVPKPPDLSKPVPPASAQPKK